MSYKHPNSASFAHMFNYDELTMDELNTMAELIRQAKKRRGKATVNALKVGDTVTWMSGRTRGRYANMKMRGQVVKVNKTRVKCDAAKFGIWNVPGSMLTRVA